jgi:uncharacterized protein YjbI with pentapeptide repeats
MKIIRPQQCIVLRNAYQLGDKAMLGISVVAGWHLGRENHFLDEAAIWAALSSAPMSLRILDACEPKPFAEFLLAGHATCAHPTASLEVDIQVGTLRKRLRATGGRASSTTEDFTRIPLDHGFSYGGRGCPDNPLGRGADASSPPPNLALRLDDDTIDEQACLAATTPLPHAFGGRAIHLGNTATSFAGDYLTRVYPGMPETVDARYFQAAAPDQRLQSAEWPDAVPYRLTGLGGTEDTVAGQVPEVRARAIVWLRASSDIPMDIPLSKKTLWFLPDARCALVVFTGHLPLADLLDEPVKDLMAAIEWNASPRPLDHYVHERQRRCSPEATGFEMLLDDELMPPGADLDVISRLADHPQSLLNRGGPRDPDASARHFAGAREAIAVASRSPMAPNDASNGLAEAFALVAASTNAADWPARLAHLAVLADLDIVAADLSCFVFGQRTLTRVRFTDCSLAGADFGGCVFDGCHFTRTDLGKANFVGATLSGVRMSAVDLAHADMEGTTWKHVAIEDSEATAARFDRANISGSLFLHVEMGDASFRDAVLEETIVSGSRMAASHLNGCRFDRCTLDTCIGDRADCSGATIERTTIQKGSWCGVRFKRSRLRSVTFGDTVPLRDASFEQACLVKVGLVNADLKRSSFIHCHFDEVCLLQASLVDSVFDHCDAPLAIMRHADLSGATILATSLQQAGLYGARLHGTRFVDCNLAGADLAMTGQDDDTSFQDCHDAGMRIHPRYRQAAKEVA